MRNKIAMRWRRKILRRGAVLKNEKPSFSKKELRENGLRKKHNGFRFDADYNGWKWTICDKDKLAAYKFFIEVMDDEILR